MKVSQERVANYLESFKNSNVLIVGDVMLDSYMWGSVDRISPEAPIPIVSVSKTEFRLGGAANVALNIKALGANPILCSVTGDDRYGQIFKDLLKKRNITDFGIIKDNERKTTVKTRVISKGQHLLRVDEESTVNISKKIEENLIARINEICNNNHIHNIIFEDYDKGLITNSFINKVKEIAKLNNIQISVDPKKRNFNNYTGIKLFKPNFKEFCEGVKIDINKDKNQINTLAEHAIKFAKQKDIDVVLITLSEQGVFICNQQEWYHIPAEIRDISDVSGAGDTVISIAALFLASNASLVEASIVSNIAGGLVCEKTGVVPVDVSELLREFE